MFADWLPVSPISCFGRTKFPRRRPAARKRHSRRTFGSLAGAQVLESRLLLAGDAEPTILVDSLADDGSGGTTLREAVELANATPGAEVIGFAEDLAGGSIVLTGGQLDLTDNVTIQGLGADQLTLDANQQGRAFFVAAGVAAELADLNIVGGKVETSDPLFGENAGGAILNFGDLTVRSSVLRGNFAATKGGAITNGDQTQAGTLSIINSLVTANEDLSGAVYNERGDLTVIDSTFSFNQGRAIYNGVGDTAVVMGSTFFANINHEAAFAGGAIFNEGQMDVVNSTFSGNLSWHHGGAIGNQGELVITNSTLAANWADWVSSPLREDWPEPRTSPWPAAGKGGGIYQGDTGSTTLSNTIVAENYMEPHRDDIAGMVNPASAHNLIGQTRAAGG